MAARTPEGPKERTIVGKTWTTIFLGSAPNPRFATDFWEFYGGPRIRVSLVYVVGERRLGFSGALLVRLGTLLGRPGASLGRFGELGPSRGLLRPSSALLGASIGRLGGLPWPSWVSLRSLFGVSWAPFGQSWGSLGQSWALLKPSGGSLGPSWGDIGGSSNRLGRW